MSTALFSFKDAVHDADLHGGKFGFVHGCVACAQTSADLALSRKAARESGLVANPIPAPTQSVKPALSLVRAA